MRGAKIIFIPTAIGFSWAGDNSGPDDTWQIVQRGHAVANALYLACVNRVGFEAEPTGDGGIDFWGRSFISDPNGKVLEEASREKEEVLIRPVDLSVIQEVREWFSFPFRDRRVDSYGPLTELYLD